MKPSTKIILALGTAGILYSVFRFRRQLTDVYNAATGDLSDQITSSIYGLKDFRIDGTDVGFTIIIDVINHSTLSATMDSMFVKVSTVAQNGDKTEILTTRPSQNGRTVTPNGTTRVDVPLRTSLLSGVSSVWSMVTGSNRLRDMSLLVEITPVVGGISLPTMNKRFSLKDFI